MVFNFNVYFYNLNKVLHINYSYCMKTFFLFLSGLIYFYSTAFAQIQGPGGVSGAKVWMQSELAFDSFSGEQFKWSDIGGDSIMLRLYNSDETANMNEHKVRSESIRFYNFYPAISLSGKGNLEFLTENTDLSQSTIFSVWAPNAEFDNDHFLYGFKGKGDDDFIMTQSHVFQSDETGKTFDYGTAEGKDMLFHQDGIEPKNLFDELNRFKERSLQIQTYYRAVQPSNSIWGKGNSKIMIGDSYPLNSNDAVYADQLAQIRNSNTPFYGFTPEFIVYNRILNPLERMKVESYLAIKYGLTLDASYINSKGELLWDIHSKDSIYNNRITGYGRDDSSKLYQTQATTSYEEAPYYAFSHSSYQTDHHYKSSAYRLLVFGKQKAGPIEDSKYLLIGDNGDSLSTSISTKEGLYGMPIMKRQWMVKTNIPTVAEADKELTWDVQGVMMHTNKFTGAITKTAASADAYGAVVTKTPLKERDGYLSWVVEEHLGTIVAKFGTSNPNPAAGDNDYGYYFDKNGEVYTIEQGTRSSDILTIISAGQKIEIEKEGNFIFLRINGHKIPQHRIIIKEQDIQSLFFGSVMIAPDTSYDIVLNNFRHGGFVDTGDWLELSYAPKRADDFVNYSRIGKTYLFIDRSGTGDFKAGEVDTIPSTDVDMERSKIIFNNIFWNKYGNGKEVFTFGYKPSKILGDITHEHPTCQGDLPIQNGAIHFKLNDGLQGFNYSLQQPLRQPQTGIFFSDTLTLDNLASGTYTLTVSEIGGTNFSNHSTETGYALSQNYALDTTNVWMEWSLIENNNAIIGFMVSDSVETNPYAATPHYGICIEGNQLYSYAKNKKNLIPIDSTIYRVRLAREENIISALFYNKEQKAVFSEEIAVIIKSDSPVYYYCAILLRNDSSPICNIKTNGFGDKTYWYLADNVQTEYSDEDQMRHTVTLKSPCDGEIVPSPPSPATGSGDNRIVAYYKNPNDRTQITVSIILDKPSAGQLLIWDAAGKPINVIQLENKREQELTVTLPTQGLYIIKVKTNNAEYTTKVL